MKKIVALVLILCITLTFLASCGTKAPIVNGNTPSGGGNASPTIGGTNNTYTRDYAGAYEFQDDLVNAMQNFVDDIKDAHDDSLPEGDKNSTEYVFVWMLYDMTLAITATLNEDPTTLTAIETVASMFGYPDAKLTHNAANDYTIKSSDNKELHCKYDTGTGSMRMVGKSDGKLTDFFEFIVLSGGKYAFQTLTERAYVEYDGTNIKSLAYTVVKTDSPYNPDNDSIYPNGSGVSSAWVSVNGIESYEQYVAFDGTTLIIDAEQFVGDRVHAEIKK